MMRGKRRSAGVLAGLVCLCLFLLTGCGEVELPEEVTDQTLAVTEDGGVILWLTGDFDQDYYKTSELEAMVRDELNRFNQQYFSRSLTAQVDSVSMTEDNSRVVVRLGFNNTEAYTAYTGEELFYGTVAEAGLAGYRLGGRLSSVKKGDVLEAQQLDKQKEKHVIITEENVRIYGPYEPQYISSGVTVNKDGSVDPAETSDCTYIIMK